MNQRLRDIGRSLLHDWPAALSHKIAAGVAKAILLLLFAGALFLAFVLFIFGAIWLVAAGALTLLGWTGLGAVLRWFRDSETEPEAHEMPSCATTPADVDLSKVLGPFNANTRRMYDAAFEGGGVKAIGQIGALARFEREGLRPRKVVATSGGAIVGALLTAGAGADQIWAMLCSHDLTRLLDPRWLPNQRWLRRALYGLLPLVPGLVLRKAAVRGREFLELMRKELEDASGLADPSFRQLKEQSGVRLEVIATDITRRKLILLPRDIVDYRGWEERDPEELSVAEAVRMSMAIPFVFEPVQLHLAKDDVRVDIVDGGVSSNYPIWRFDRDAAGPRFPTFGFLLDEDERAPKAVRGLVAYAWNVVQSGIGAIDRVLSAHDEYRSVRIPTLRVATTQFDLPAELQGRLFCSGYQAAEEKLREFDWSKYVTTFRGGHARAPVEAAGMFEAAPAVAEGVAEPRMVVEDVEYTLAQEDSLA